MGTKTVTFKGKTQWFRPGYIDREYEDTDNGRGGNYAIDVFLDEASVKLFHAIGPRAKLKDGNLARFRRYEYANFGKGPESLGPPKYSGFEEGVSIGNGSDVSVVVEYYTTTFKGKSLIAMRLVSVHVDNVIEYIKPSDTPFDDNTPPVH